MPIIFSLFFLPLALALSPDEIGKRTAACDLIYRRYSTCGSNLRFNGKVFDFFWNREQTIVPCTDGRSLSFYDRLESMDISSILQIPYVAGPTPLPETRKNWDPGRLRSEPLFQSVFGFNEASVRANLVPVIFLGQRILFQKQLGAAAALERVGKQLEEASSKDPSLAAFLAPFTEKKIDLKLYGFFWRFVKGTSRLSTHSFGTGIDLLLDQGPQYWLWDEQKKNPQKASLGESAYRDDHYIPDAAPRFHKRAVEIFEKNGFIWGGKWNHYDTMHFEYRPELLPEASIDCRRFSSQQAGFSPEQSLLLPAAHFEPEFADH